MPQWPPTIPEDLRHLISAALDNPDTTPIALWAIVVEWAKGYVITLPHDMPDRAHRLVATALEFRNRCPNTIWSEVRDWLVKEGLEAPEGLRERGEIRARMGP